MSEELAMIPSFQWHWHCYVCQYYRGLMGREGMAVELEWTENTDYL